MCDLDQGSDITRVKDQQVIRAIVQCDKHQGPGSDIIKAQCATRFYA